MSDENINLSESVYRLNQLTQEITDSMVRISKIAEPIYQKQNEIFDRFYEASRVIATASERLYEAAQPSLYLVGKMSLEINEKLNGISSILANLPNTEKFLSVFNSEIEPELFYNLASNVVLEVEENYQNHTYIDENENDAYKEESEKLIEKFFDDIDDGVSPSVIKSYIEKVPEAIRTYIADMLINIVLGVLWYCASGQIESDPVKAILGPVIFGIKLLLGRD